MGRKGQQRRVYDEIKVDGQTLYTLFDSGARNSYITREAVRKLGLKPQKFRHPYPAGLGGKKHLIREDVNMEGTLHGLPLRLHPFVIDELGTDERQSPLELLFGMLAMEQWGVELDPRRKKLDLSFFTKDFTEF